MKAKGEPSGKSDAVKIVVSPDEGLIWISCLWRRRNGALGGAEDTTKARGLLIDRIEALVRALGVKTEGPTTRDKHYVAADLDRDSLLQRVAGIDRAAWAKGGGGARGIEASVAFTDEEWFDILNATLHSVLARNIIEEGNSEVLDMDDFEEELALYLELVGGLFFSLRESSDRNRDLFERWLKERVLREGTDLSALVGDDLTYRLWRRLTLNRWLSALC